MPTSAVSRAVSCYKAAAAEVNLWDRLCQEWEMTEVVPQKTRIGLCRAGYRFKSAIISLGLTMKCQIVVALFYLLVCLSYAALIINGGDELLWTRTEWGSEELKLSLPASIVTSHFDDPELEEFELVSTHGPHRLSHYDLRQAKRLQWHAAKRHLADTTLNHHAPAGPVRWCLTLLSAIRQTSCSVSCALC